MAAKKFHSFMLTVALGLVAWFIVNMFIVKITILQFIIIEVFMAFMEILSTFVKVKVGLEEDSESSN
jgi:hypothetical protein